MRKSSACGRRPTQDRPTLNLYDIPEMMAGAQPSANSVERERFNARCRKLWEEDYGETSKACEVPQHGTAADRYSQVEKVFPDLDPELIWNMCHETTNLQQIVDTLLALSASMASDAHVGSSGDNEAAVDANSRMPRELQTAQRPLKEHVPQSDGGAWPSLLDNDGWEVVNYQALQQQDQDLGSAWCKTAKDAAHLPAPKPSLNTTLQTKQKQKEAQTGMDAIDDVEEDRLPTDYDLRHMRGQIRATKRAANLAAKSMAREENRACNNGPQETEQLPSESEDSFDTVSEN